MTDYRALLEQIQLTTSVENRALNIASVENSLACINVDWTARTVTLPPAYKSFLSVANDHRAATIYFSCDRYFDDVDLAGMTIVIEYINGAGEGRVAPVLDIDLNSEPGKIIFGWKIGHETTKASGKIQFAVHIYTINPATHSYAYSMMTRPCEANILKALETADIDLEDAYDFSASQVNDVLGRLTALEHQAVSWTDLAYA